jgi:curved DNA-binding protein CbpA
MRRGRPGEARIDAYEVLGVDPTVTDEELRRAHRRLVRHHHPDHAPPEARAEATRRVQTINLAYGLVRDPERRAHHDRLRARAVLDRDAAAQWDALARSAGRWAGRWWRTHRLTARDAGMMVGRTLRAARRTR